MDELLADHAFFVEPSEGSDLTSLKSRVSELETKVQNLREQLCRAKNMNDSIWDIVMQEHHDVFNCWSQSQSFFLKIFFVDFVLE